MPWWISGYTLVFCAGSFLAWAFGYTRGFRDGSNTERIRADAEMHAVARRHRKRIAEIRLLYQPPEESPPSIETNNESSETSSNSGPTLGDRILEMQRLDVSTTGSDSSMSDQTSRVIAYATNGRLHWLTNEDYDINESYHWVTDEDHSSTNGEENGDSCVMVDTEPMDPMIPS